MAAMQLFFEEPTQLHLESVGAGGHSQVKIEETVIDGLQGNRETHVSCELRFHLRKARHRAE
jgi:hypothetical protein